MRRIWRRAVVWMLAAAVILGGGIIGARTAKAADNQIVTDYNTSIGTGTPMLFGGVGTPGRTDDKAWQAVQGTMGIKIVKVYIDLGKLFPKNADEMDSGAYEEYAHVASGLLTRVKGAGMTAMLEFQNLPAWLDDGNGMYHSKTDYEKMIKKFLGDAKADFEGCISHVEIVPPASLGESDFKDYYFTTAEAVRAELPNTIIGGMGYTLKSSKDTLSPNVKAVLAQSAAEDPSLLQFVSVRGYGVDSVGSTEDYFGEFKEGRKAIRKALDNRDLPLYMTGWSTSASDAKTADSKITGADGIKYQASALFKAMRDGWDMVMFDGTVSSKDRPGSYSYTIDGSGNVTMNPFTKVYDLLANRLGLNTGDFKVVSTDMGSDWPVDDSIAMVNKKEEPVMLLMNFDKAKSGIRLEMKNVPYQDGKVELEGYVASADQDSTKKYLSLTADVTNGILTAKIPTVPANCAMGIIVKGKEKKVLPAQSIYEFESQDNQFGGNTEIAWYTDASFNRIVKGFDGASNFVTLKDVAADGTGTYMAHLYAASPNDHVKVSVNGKAPIDVDCSSVSIKTPASFKVNLEAGHENTLKFYTQSGELRPDRLVLEAKDVQLSIGIQNLSELEKDGQQYILPLAKKDFKVDARIFPEAAAAGKTLVYESSDPSVVAVSADGTLTPNKTGTTAITVKIQGTDIHNSFDIVVKNAVASVSVTPANLTLRQGGTAVLTAQITPSDAENQNVQWESSAPDVVEITEQNQKTASIRAVAESGTASITAKTEDGGKTAVCTVTVVKPVPGGDVTVDYGNTVSTGDPKIFGVTHYPNVNKNDSDIGDHSSVWPMLTNDAGVKFMRADARLQEILPIWRKTPDTNWEKPTGQNADQPNYVKSDYYYVTGPDGVKRKFSVDGYKEDMEYYQKHHTYLNGMSNPDNWNTGRLLSWVNAAKAQGYQVMVMTFQIPEWLSSGEVVSSDPSTKKVCNGAPKD